MGRYQEIQKLQRHQKAEKEGGEEGKLDETGVSQLSSTLQLLDTTLLKCYIKVGEAGLKTNLDVLH